MPSDEITTRVYQLIDPIVAEENCELLDVELATEVGQRVLRVYINKEGGVNVDDCSRVSQAIEDVIDVEGGLAGRYSLEVSSPGINRPLTKPKHYADVMGKVVQIQTTDKIDGRRNYKGIVRKVTDQDVTVEIDETEFCLPLNMIRKAHLVAI